MATLKDVLAEATYVFGPDGTFVKKEKDKDKPTEKQDSFWDKFVKSSKPPEGKPSKPGKEGGLGPDGDSKDKSYKSDGKPKEYSKWTSAGGVVLGGKDDLEHVWIRKAKGKAYGGWTFAKGMVDKGESQEQAAVREVEEEMGVKAQIIPGSYLGKYEGTASYTHYYMMYATSASGKHDNETEKVLLATWTEAMHKFAKSGNTRDIKVLTKAMEFVEKLKRHQMGKSQYDPTNPPPPTPPRHKKD